MIGTTLRPKPNCTIQQETSYKNIDKSHFIDRGLWEHQVGSQIYPLQSLSSDSKNITWKKNLKEIKETTYY